MKELEFKNGSSIKVADNPDAPLRGKSRLSDLARKKGKEHLCPDCKKKWVCQHPACPFPHLHYCPECAYPDDSIPNDYIPTSTAQTEGVIEREQPITLQSLEKVIASVALKTPSHIMVMPSVMAEIKKTFEPISSPMYSTALEPKTLFGMKVEVIPKHVLTYLPIDIQNALKKGEIAFLTIPPISCRDFPACSHKHDKAWDAGCAVCTPDDNCCKTNEDECPLEE